MVATSPCLLFRLRLLCQPRFWVLRRAWRVSMDAANLFFSFQTFYIAYSISNIRYRDLSLMQRVKLVDLQLQTKVYMFWTSNLRVCWCTRRNCLEKNGREYVYFSLCFCKAV